MGSCSPGLAVRSFIDLDVRIMSSIVSQGSHYQTMRNTGPTMLVV